MAGHNVHTFSDTDWDTQVLKSDKPVLVDFWAEWCGPCRMLAPTIEQLADEYVGKFTVGKLNVDDNPQAASRYNVRGIPTLLVFQGGQVKDQLVGAQPKASIEKILNKYTS